MSNDCPGLHNFNGKLITPVICFSGTTKSLSYNGSPPFLVYMIASDSYRLLPVFMLLDAGRGSTRGWVWLKG